MSESYNIEGVTVTPQGGGFYVLTHPGLAAPIKERGKEVADARAVEIAAQMKDAEASMGAQGPLDTVPPPPPPILQPQSNDVAVLQAQLAQANAEKALAEARAQIAEMQVRTVTHDGGDEQPVLQTVHPAMPRRYEGVLDDAAKAKLRAMGTDVVDIRLEESADIPPTGLFVGHNGRGYMIRPGERVSVPQFLLNVLDDAITSVPITDPVSQRVVAHRNKMRYPYTRLN